MQQVIRSAIGSHELAAMSRMFSAGVLRGLAREERSASTSRVLRQTGLFSSALEALTLEGAFERVFATLSVQGRRDDYVFRNALARKLVIGRRSLRTATVLQELRVGNSKVDVAVLAKQGIAYEIKSDRDSYSRLSSQVADYRRAFSNVVVVASEPRVELIDKLVPETTGIASLTERFSLRMWREPVFDTDGLSVPALLRVLRLAEASEVLRLLGIEVPSVPNTLIRSTLESLAMAVEPTDLQAICFEVLRVRRSQASLAPALTTFPPSLHSAILALGLTHGEVVGLRRSLDLSVADVLSWG